MKHVYKSFEIEINCEEERGQWLGVAHINPEARGVSTFAPIFPYPCESECETAALQMAKDHIDRIIGES